ncbi:hypothetical protein [Nocardia sp. XZ_19_369]|uniref:hypothetical protein n=1 Tax=Nocardia sp. XZ_19_369 TaxID=2769487 RepID=UPI00188FD1D5|nr:hypothetical protein [Nocardia sp. XZ_19_369]
MRRSQRCKANLPNVGMTMLVVYHAYAAFDAHNKRLGAAVIVSPDLSGSPKPLRHSSRT